MTSSLSSRAHGIDSYVSNTENLRSLVEGGPSGPRLTSLFVGGSSAMRG